MAHPLKILVEATIRVARSYYHAVLLSALWLPAQLLIITGPPATAVLFAMARHDTDDFLWNTGNARYAFQELFAPAWRWALVNLLPAVGLVVLPFMGVWNEPGIFGLAVRLVWALAGAVWLGVNLYYWPAWLAADEPSIRNGYRGSLHLWRRQPVVTFYIFLVCFLVGMITLPFLLPLVMGTVYWIALAAEMTYHHSIVRNSAI